MGRPGDWTGVLKVSVRLSWGGLGPALRAPSLQVLCPRLCLIVTLAIVALFGPQFIHLCMGNDYPARPIWGGSSTFTDVLSAFGSLLIFQMRMPWQSWATQRGDRPLLLVTLEFREAYAGCADISLARAPGKTDAVLKTEGCPGQAPVDRKQQLCRAAGSPAHGSRAMGSTL